MAFLETKVPPPIIGLLSGALMWALAHWLPVVSLPSSIRGWVALLLAVCGFCIAIAGVISFRRAKTTISPLDPAETSALVTSGVYRFSRNPMYLGLAVVLIGWSVYLASLWSLVGVALFVLYIQRFQIRPEERMLQQLFGAAFEAYCRHVRRWI